MSNEPVAWMYESKNVDGKPYISDVSLKPLFGLVTRYGYKEIPLYTHPVKELTLTEDEIDDVWAACSTGESDTIDMHLFAEAILKKAQER